MSSDKIEWTLTPEEIERLADPSKVLLSDVQPNLQPRRKFMPGKSE